VKITPALFLILPAAVCLWLVGCSSPNPVKGWKSHYANLDQPNLTNYHNYPNTWYYRPDQIYHIDQAIIDDYKAYAHKVWPKDRDFFISELYFYEDGTGRHAVKIVLETGSRKFKEYYLMYDTNNVRTKVIKGKTWHQFHI